MFGVSNYPARSGSRGPLASMTVDDKITILVAVEQIDLTIEDVSWALGYHSATYGLRYSWTATLDALIGLLHDLDSPAHWRLRRAWAKPWWEHKTDQKRTQSRLIVHAKLPEIEAAIRDTEEKLLKTGDVLPSRIDWKREERAKAYQDWRDKEACYLAHPECLGRKIRDAKPSDSDEDREAKKQSWIKRLKECIRPDSPVAQVARDEGIVLVDNEKDDDDDDDDDDDETLCGDDLHVKT